jgi:hypothetical protein
MMNSLRTRLLFSLVVVLAGVACNPDPDQRKREEERQKVIQDFDKQQFDEQLSNWNEPRLLAALSSSNASDRANAARELGFRRTVNARQPLRDLMLGDRNEVVVNESELALIRIGDPEDIAAIRDYAAPRVESLDATFLHNLYLLDDPWAADLLKEASRKAPDKQRRAIIVDAQTRRRERMGH